MYQKSFFDTLMEWSLFSISIITKKLKTIF